MRELAREVGRAWRAWRGKPLSSVLILLTLSLAIGTNLAVLSLLKPALYPTFAVGQPRELVRVFATSVPGGEDRWEISYPVYRDYRDRNTVFSGLAAYRDDVPVHVAAGASAPRRVDAALVSGNYFEVLRVSTAHGRLLRQEDDSDGATSVVVISQRLWERDFEGKSPVIGEVLEVNGISFTVIGVVPPEFTGLDPEDTPELYLPIARSGVAEPMLRGQMRYRSSAFFQMVGRLAPQASLENAQARLSSLTERLRAQDLALPEEQGFEDPWVRLVPLGNAVGPKAASTAWYLVLGAVALLAAACAHVTSYFLAHYEEEEYSLMLEVALGCSLRRLVGRKLAEGLLFGGAAAVTGLLLTLWLVPLLGGLLPTGLPIPTTGGRHVLDRDLVKFVVGYALATGVLVAAAPIARLAKGAKSRALNQDLAHGATSSGRSRIRTFLVGLQVAASVSLLMVAGLLGKEVVEILATEPGFETEARLVAFVDVARQGYAQEEGQTVLEELQRRLEAVPGVRSAAVSAPAPLPVHRNMRIPSPGESGGEEIWVGRALITAGYFRTLGIRILRGRELVPADRRDGQGVAVISRAAAESLWGDPDVVGETLSGVGPQGRSVRVVGVAADVQTDALEVKPAAVIYLPLAQFYQDYGWQPKSAALLVHVDGRPGVFEPAVRETVGHVNRRLPVFNIRPLDDHYADTYALPKFLSVLVGCLGIGALTIAVTGLHALLTFFAVRGRRELAIRVMLGAGDRDLRRLMYSQSLKVVGAGLAGGVLAGGMMASSLRLLLVGDGDTYSVAVLPLVLVLLLAAASVLASRGAMKRILSEAPARALRDP